MCVRQTWWIIPPEFIPELIPPLSFYRSFTYLTQYLSDISFRNAVVVTINLFYQQKNPAALHPTRKLYPEPDASGRVWTRLKQMKITKTHPNDWSKYLTTLQHTAAMSVQLNKASNTWATKLTCPYITWRHNSQLTTQQVVEGTVWNRFGIHVWLKVF